MVRDHSFAFSRGATVRRMIRPRASVACLGFLVASSWLGGCGTMMVESKTRGWIAVETTSLRLRTQVRESWARELAARYQRLHDAIAEHELPCAFDRMTAPVEVIVVDEPDEPSVYRAPPTKLLGLQPQVVIQSIGGRDSERAFAHELTHRLVALCFPTAPTWFHEGMAGFYETARLHEDTLELGFPAYVFLPESRWDGNVYNQLGGETVFVLPDSWAPSVAALRSMRRDAFYAADQRVQLRNYAGAWALVHLLKHGDLRLAPLFIRYQRALHEGTEEADAWESSFANIDVAGRYRSYLGEEVYARVRSVRVPEPEGITVRPLSSGEAGLMLAALERWDRDDGVERASAFIELASEQKSTAMAARLYRGALHAGQQDLQEAKRWFEDALADSPDDPGALAAALSLDLFTAKGNFPAGPTRQTRDRLDRLVERGVSAHHFAVAAAWEVYAARDAAEGIALARRAIELDGASFAAYVALGDGCALAGRLECALGAYRAALALSRHATDGTRAKLQRQVEELRRRGM